MAKDKKIGKDDIADKEKSVDGDIGAADVLRENFDKNVQIKVEADKEIDKEDICDIEKNDNTGNDTDIEAALSSDKCDKDVKVEVEVEADKKSDKFEDISNVDDSNITSTVPLKNGIAKKEKYSKTLKSKNFTDSGPEEFHEIEIDAPNTDNKRIIFDIDEDEKLRESFKKKMADDGDDDNDGGPKEPYQPSKMEKILNIMLCRKDLVNQKLSERPVKFWDLVSFD
uniref:Uncharacterized protein n=1 Tax=Panagrolaimus superbus TaxID=310955 RepID=A0A914XWW7_9BILA